MPNIDRFRRHFAPVVIGSFGYSRFAANILNGTSSFDRLQNGNDLVLGESGFTHDDLLRGHNQYVGRSLKVNGPFYRDAYTMPLPNRMRPTKVSSKKINELANKAKQILSRIDEGFDEQDSVLEAMIVEWNSQVACPYAFSDFRDFSSWTSAREFTRMAFNLAKFYADFTWDELVQTLRCVSDAKSKESEQNFALALLEKNFDGNPSDLIFWPDEWFQDPDMFHVDLTTEEIAGYLMARSGRHLADAPEIELKYPIPMTNP